LANYGLIIILKKISKNSFSSSDNEHNLLIGHLEYFLEEIKIKQSHDPHHKSNENNIIIEIIEKFKNQLG